MSRGGDELTTQPNVLLIDRDKVASGANGCYAGGAPTSRIGVLATERTRFQNYSVEAKCTPNVSTLSTGRLPIASCQVGQRC